MVWPKIDVLSTLYDGSAVTADGTSSVIDFNVAGGCPDGEVLLTVEGRATGESVVFIVQNWNGSTYVDSYLRTGSITANGDYVIPINNRVVTGSKFRIRHDVTMPTGGGSLNFRGHFQPLIKP